MGMYGLSGTIKARPGQREPLVAMLLDGIGDMPGCLGYVVAMDSMDPDSLWINEVWDSVESHRASLDLPAVRALIDRARPLIAGFGHRIETRPVGGLGLAS